MTHFVYFNDFNDMHFVADNSRRSVCDDIVYTVDQMDGELVRLGYVVSRHDSHVDAVLAASDLNSVLEVLSS